MKIMISPVVEHPSERNLI